MAQLVVRNVSDDVKESLRRRASGNGRSLEAEARAILSEAAGAVKQKPASSSGLGTQLARRMKRIGVTRKDTDAVEANIAELRKSWRMRDVDFDK